MKAKQIMKKESAAVLFLGGLTGVSTALLFAPRSAKQTRQRIGEFAVDVRERAESYIGLFKEKVTSSVDRRKVFLQERKSIITTAVEAGKEAYKKEKERLLKEHERTKPPLQ
jgi:gas vesicle protein